MYIEGASLIATQHDFLMLWVNIITIISFLIVNGILIYFIIRYRRRSDNDVTSKVDNNLLLEVFWTTVPTLILIWLYIWGLRVFIDMRTVPKDATEINVLGKQWAWTFTYSPKYRKDKKKETVLKSNNILYLEANKPVKLVMQSTDVLHSFFIPAFRIKEDVVPNFYTYTTFTPIFPPQHKGKDKLEYDIFCTEYCGKDHSRMIGKAVILSTKKFKENILKIEQEAGNITSARGQALYNGNCKSCHTLDGTRLVGPSFKGLWGANRKFTDGTEAIVDENYIQESILLPNQKVVEGYPAAMPVQDYNNAEIRSLIQYIKNIK